MWIIYNQSNAALSVNDIPEPQEVLSNTSASFSVSDVTTSHILAENIANGALVVTSFGTFGTAGPWLPVTYPVHLSGAELQDGYSNPVTVGVFTQGQLLLNVTAISVGGSLEIGWQEWDGAAYYPASILISSVTATGPISVPFSTYGIAGRATWTVSGSATFSLLLQMR